jgi:hypothetical protein
VLDNACLLYLSRCLRTGACTKKLEYTGRVALPAFHSVCYTTPMCTPSNPQCSRDPAPLWLGSAQARLSFGSGLLRSAHLCSPLLTHCRAISDVPIKNSSSFSEGLQICPGSRIRAPVSSGPYSGPHLRWPRSIHQNRCVPRFARCAERVSISRSLSWPPWT